MWNGLERPEAGKKSSEAIEKKSIRKEEKRRDGGRRGEAQRKWDTGTAHPLCSKKLTVMTFKTKAGKRPVACHLLQKIIYTYNERSI